jgi:hypothetical protein
VKLAADVQSEVLAVESAMDAEDETGEELDADAKQRGLP